MTNEIDAFLGDLGTGEQDIFSNDPQDIPEFGTSEKPEVTEEETREKTEPFHKNPKIKRFIEKEISKALETKGTETERFSRESGQDASDDLTSVLVRIIGNDTQEKVSAVSDLKKALESKARKEAQEYISVRESEAKKAQEEAETALDEAFDAIEETHGVDLSSNTPTARKTRAEFLSFVQRIAPKDGNGNITEYPDFNEVYDVFKGMNRGNQSQATNSRAKEIASRGMARSTETRASAPAKRITWDSVENDMDRLTK